MAGATLGVKAVGKGRRGCCASTAPISTVVGKIRTKALPRWSGVRSAGTRALEPALTRGLPGWGIIVMLPPPLSAKGFSSRFVPYGRLLANEASNPLSLPIALYLMLMLVGVLLL